MKQDPFSGVYRALTPKELAEMFMNPHAPKTEAEHWAVREIEKLRADIERLTRERDEARAALEPFSELYLWPDDAGRLIAERVRAREDWDEAANDAESNEFGITRGDIRAARRAMEAKP